MNNFDDILNNASSNEEQNSQRLSTEEYAAKKKAEREAVYELSDNTAMEVATDGDKFQQYLDVQANFSRYSAINTLLILAQKPDAARLGDFDYWKNQGAYVGKGQTGISILEPGKEYQREDGSVGVSYNIKKVFDVSQVDALKIKSSSVPQFTERQMLSALISKAPMKINGIDNISNGLGAYTDPDTGEIFVRKGMEFADTFSAVALELSYAEVTSDGIAVAEPRFSAYYAAYLLCKKYGVDTQNFTFNDAPYIFNGLDAQDVKYELSQIRAAADTISGRMAKQLDAVTKAAKNRDEARCQWQFKKAQKWRLKFVQKGH
jgi:hypothetical protein